MPDPVAGTVEAVQVGAVRPLGPKAVPKATPCGKAGRTRRCMSIRWPITPIGRVSCRRWPTASPLARSAITSWSPMLSQGVV